MTETVKQRWERFDARRRGVLARARECAELTIPGLLPPEGHREDNPLPTPFQSLGARGVNNLASKLLLALLPPNQTFYKFEADEKVLAELEAEDPNARSKTQRRLSKVEQSILGFIEGNAYRPSLYEAVRSLIAVGNSLVYLPKEGGMKVYRLDQFIVRRDRAGNVLETIIREMIDPKILDPKVRKLCDVDANHSDDHDCEIFTRVHRDGQKWKVYQELKDQRVPDSEGTFPLDRPGFIPLRWSHIPGEDYGRGLVDEYIGDLRSLESATKSIIKFAANASKILWLVNPNGLTQVRDIAKGESGDFVPGREADITMLGLDKFPDFKMVWDVAQALEGRLHQCFLLNASIQRDAERVTATEVQFMARELEDALGGVYSVLSQEFQLPFIRRVMAIMEKKGELPHLPEDIVKTRITTGLEALGRGHDLKKLMRLMEIWSKAVPAELLVQHIDFEDFIRRTAAAEGVDTEGLVKTAAQRNQAQNQGMLRNVAEQAGPRAIQEIVKQQGAIPPNG